MKKNPLGYSCLSDETLRKVMGTNFPNKKNYTQEEIDSLSMMLEWNNVPSGNKESGNEFTRDEAINKFIPPLLGDDIRTHFEALAEDLLEPWYENILNLVANKPICLDHNLPSIELDSLQAGWNRFTTTLQGHWNPPVGVSEVLEDYAVIDTETFVKGSEQAHVLLATAINDKALYVWVHPQLLDDSVHEDYIPMLPNVGKGKVLVAHNSAYDYPRFTDSYTLENLTPKTGNAWLCTMSMNRVINGVDSKQVWAYNKKWKPGENKPYWYFQGCPGNLIDCYNYHVGRKKVSKDEKSIREAFVKIPRLEDFKKMGLGNPKVYNEPWKVVYEQSSEDRNFVETKTGELKRLFNLEDLIRYALRDVVYTLELFQSIYPKYIAHVNSYIPLIGHIYMATSLLPVADDWNSWVEGTSRYVQNLLQESRSILGKHSQYPSTIAREYLRDDTWYCHLSGAKKDRNFEIPDSHKKKNAHYVMKLRWQGKPIVEKKGQGFGYYEDAIFHRLPHPEGKDANVGNVFVKYFWKKAQDGILTSDVSTEDFKRLCEIQWLTSFWLSVESRVKGKFIYRIPTPDGIGSCNVMPLNLIPHNTITLRSGENLWYTTAAHAGAKCGAEIRGKVHAPPGYKIVSFDFASQESNILSAYGASYAGISGSTPFDYTNLVGDKSKGTDIHSLTAKSIDAERDPTKSAVYAVLYGAEKKTVAETFQKANPDAPMSELVSKAVKMLANFKGTKTKEGNYHGGSASETFNIMREMLAKDEIPYTPQLGVQMSLALTPKNTLRSNTPSQLNWLCQSAGSSILYSTASAIVWLMMYYGLKGRLLVTFFDELVFLIKEEDAYKLAWCCQIAHCWAWSCLHYQIGIYDLPCNRAWLDGISIDYTWRKSPKEKYKTPTFQGYDAGNEVNMDQIVASLFNL